MRKSLMVLVATLLAFNAANATSADERLQAAGIIDSNYRYVSEEIAINFFREMSNQIASSLPQKANGYIETNYSFFTPKLASIHYRFLMPFDKNQREIAIKALTSKENLFELCKSSFSNKYLWANDYHIVYTYSDMDYQKLASVDLDTEACAPIKYDILK